MNELNYEAFSLDQLIDTVITGELDTSRRNIPEGEYVGIVTEISKPRLVDTQRGKQPVVQAKIEIDTSSVADQIGQTKATRYWDMWLDLTSSGAIDTGPGKNIAVGKLREACGKNNSSALRDLLGSPVRVKVKSRVIKSGAREGEVTDTIADLAPM